MKELISDASAAFVAPSPDALSEQRYSGCSGLGSSYCVDHPEAGFDPQFDDPF